MDGRTDGRHVQKQWSLPAVTVGRPRGSKWHANLCQRSSSLFTFRTTKVQKCSKKIEKDFLFLLHPFLFFNCLKLLLQKVFFFIAIIYSGLKTSVYYDKHGQQIWISPRFMEKGYANKNVLGIKNFAKIHIYMLRVFPFIHNLPIEQEVWCLKENRNNTFYSLFKDRRFN